MPQVLCAECHITHTCVLCVAHVCSNDTLVEVLKGIKTYSMMVHRSKRKGNREAQPFCTTRTKLPMHQSVLDLLTMYVAVQRLLINTDPEGLSMDIFPTIPSGGIGRRLKQVANAAMGTPDILIGGYSVR